MSQPTGVGCRLREQRTEGGFLVTSFDLEVPGLASEAEGYRLVQLSDFHLGSATRLSHLEAGFLLTDRLRPDTVVLTGDYVQHGRLGIHHKFAEANPHLFGLRAYRKHVRRLAAELGSAIKLLQPKDGVYGVWGNHDYLEGKTVIRKCLAPIVTWLDNESVTIAIGDAMLRITGLDDVRKGKPDPARALAVCTARTSHRGGDATSVTPPDIDVLLVHNPDYVLTKASSVTAGSHLMLCGHTHGGQIRMPGMPPPITRTTQKLHVTGLSKHNDTWIYVNNGLGYGAFGVRVFCPPEISVFDLKRAPEASA